MIATTMNFLNSRERKAKRAASHPYNMVSLSANEVLDRCICSGWMVKEGGSVKSWKHRFVVFDGFTLYYFKEETSKEQCGEVPLESVIKISTSHMPKKPNLVVLDAPGRTFLFQAKSEDDMNNWHTVLTTAYEQIQQEAAANGNGSNAGRRSPNAGFTLNPRHSNNAFGSLPRGLSLSTTVPAGNSSPPLSFRTFTPPRDRGSSLSPYGTPTPPPIFGTPPIYNNSTKDNRGGSLAPPPTSRERSGSILGKSTGGSTLTTRERTGSLVGTPLVGTPTTSSALAATPAVVAEWVKSQTEGTISGPSGSWLWSGPGGELVCTEGKYEGAICTFTGDKFYHNFTFGSNVEWDGDKIIWTTSQFGVLFEATATPTSNNKKTMYEIPNWEHVIVSAKTASHNKLKHKFTGSVPSPVLAIVALLIRIEEVYKEKDEFNKKFKTRTALTHTQRIQQFKQQGTIVIPQRNATLRPRLHGARCTGEDLSGNVAAYVCEKCGEDYCVACDQFNIGDSYDGKLCSGCISCSNSCAKCDKPLKEKKLRAKLCSDCGSQLIETCCKRRLKK